MADSILANETVIRLICFLGIFVVMALWEVSRPRRRQTVSRRVRWLGHLGVLTIDTAISRVLTPTAAVGMAVLSADRGWGLLNQFELPVWVSFGISVVALDFAIYLQHVMFHAVPVLWRVHRMHHADIEFDLTTGVRFHPIEIVLSMGIKLCAVVVLGPPAIAVLIFEVILNATSLFNHSNIRLPLVFDRMLRCVVVTPDMHRVHHSVEPTEANSNFGFNLAWWDRLLGTYRAQPDAGHESMIIGIHQFRAIRDLRIDRMLLQPFVGQVGSYPINRRGISTRE